MRAAAHSHADYVIDCLLQGTGEDEEDVESSSATLVQSEEGYAPVFFTPRALRNLVLVDEMPSLMPLTDMKVANLLNEEIPQIYALTGRYVITV
jgi:splicing factor 3B subunit 3